MSDLFSGDNFWYFVGGAIAFGYYFYSKRDNGQSHDIKESPKNDSKIPLTHDIENTNSIWSDDTPSVGDYADVHCDGSDPVASSDDNFSRGSEPSMSGSDNSENINI